MFCLYLQESSSTEESDYAGATKDTSDPSNAAGHFGVQCRLCKDVHGDMRLWKKVYVDTEQSWVWVPMGRASYPVSMDVLRGVVVVH